MHVPVMKNEVLDLLAVRSGGCYIDGTVGLGGHTEAMLERSGPDGRVLGIDRDADALARASERLVGFAARLVLVCGHYADVEAIADASAFHDVDGMLMDLGVSSMQLDEADRGFSFMHDGPLDMRMDRSQALTAADLVNDLDERALADMIFQFGEEPASRRIAAALVRERTIAPIVTTGRLATVVTEAKGGRTGRAHPATRTFQALRMAVNHELDGLERGLEAALRTVRPDGGRLAVITFHSLEDREVKRRFRAHEPREESLAGGGAKATGIPPFIKRVNKKSTASGHEERTANPRARSARLRVVERI